jgi:hypothetical protein
MFSTDASFLYVTGRKNPAKRWQTQYTSLFDRQLTVLLGVGWIAGRERSIRCRVFIVHAAVGGVEAVPVRLVQGGLGEGERVVGGGAHRHQGGHRQEGVHLQQPGCIKKDRQRKRERLFSIPFIKRSTHCIENPIYVFPEIKLRGLIPCSEDFRVMSLPCLATPPLCFATPHPRLAIPKLSCATS